jgi:uncharacterized membrane protein YbaN (DUF454 family)
MIELLALLPFVTILTALWVFNRACERLENHPLMRTTPRSFKRNYSEPR